MTNRRSFLSSLAGASTAAWAIAYVPISEAQAESINRHYATCECSGMMVEALAHEIINETGGWKEHILSTRKNGGPMVVTRHGCCCIEIALKDGSHHPDWTYTYRQLTIEERRSFHEEYGNSAPLLTCLTFNPTMEIRGFILNGRREGWNLSVRTIKV